MLLKVLNFVHAEVSLVVFVGTEFALRAVEGGRRNFFGYDFNLYFFICF